MIIHLERMMNSLLRSGLISDGLVVRYDSNASLLYEQSYKRNRPIRRHIVIANLDPRRDISRGMHLLIITCVLPCKFTRIYLIAMSVRMIIL